MGAELVLRLEDPAGPGLAALLAEREAYLRGLYPDRAGLRRAVELEAQVLGFYGLRSGGEIVGCGGLIIHPGFLEARITVTLYAIDRRPRRRAASWAWGRT